MGGPHGPLLGKVGGPMGPESSYGAPWARSAQRHRSHVQGFTSALSTEVSEHIKVPLAWISVLCTHREALRASAGVPGPPTLPSRGSRGPYFTQKGPMGPPITKNKMKKIKKIIYIYIYIYTYI